MVTLDKREQRRRNFLAKELKENRLWRQRKVNGAVKYPEKVIKARDINKLDPKDWENIE